MRQSNKVCDVDYSLSAVLSWADVTPGNAKWFQLLVPQCTAQTSNTDPSRSLLEMQSLALPQTY